jgi:C4-dicarboxylate-specific signal transduction histidine kinase
LHQRRERARAEELLRLGQVARLNTLGELAAGMAHELNQPLTAVLANTQAAVRLLKESPPEIDTAQTAMQRASEQARRASDVLTRLRRSVERPDMQAGRARVRLNDAVRDAMYLLEPQCRAHRVTAEIVSDRDVEVLADPVALEQIIHNLVTNALHALDQIDGNERRFTLAISQTERQGELRIADNGPGIAPDALPRLFEPFFSTRGDAGGLGLGLSMCESLVTGMDGQISAQNRSPRGAEFLVTLPLAARSVHVEPVEP